MLKFLWFLLILITLFILVRENNEEIKCQIKNDFSFGINSNGGMFWINYKEKWFTF